MTAQMSRAEKSAKDKKAQQNSTSFKPQHSSPPHPTNFVQDHAVASVNESEKLRLPRTIHEMLRNYLWRQRLKFEATLAFSMLEPWEKILSYLLRNVAVVIFAFFTLLLVTGLYRYLPQHVSIMRQRATYYLWGQDGDDRLLRHLVDPSTLKEL